MKIKRDKPATFIAIIFICVGIFIVFTGKASMADTFTVVLMEYEGTSAIFIGLSLVLTGIVILISDRKN